MKRIDVLIVGAGQAGLAMSRELSRLGIDHVVVERGRVAERWRSERWDSLRLLTPNWHTRLPDYRYTGPDPDGFMSMPDIVAFLSGYADAIAAPVQEDTAVLAVLPFECCGYRVLTTRGTWTARAVIIATGQSETARVPPIARYLPPGIVQVAPNRYRRPSDLPDGGVLVVGASASGVQLADELAAAGRDVTLAAGHHTRLPREYRGLDIIGWLDRLGLFEQSASEVADLGASRRQPSLQLIGRPGTTLGLLELAARGVRLAGRLVDVRGPHLTFADDLIGSLSGADMKMAALLQRIDRFIDIAGHPSSDRDPGAPPFVPSWPLAQRSPGPAALHLTHEHITSVIWATGFEPRYPWLQVPVLDGAGQIQHAGGVTPAPGLFVIGLPFLRRRKSSFIDGVGDDARALAALAAARVGHHARSA
jgi:putative flavoprotein involved in K+ transport